METAPHRLVDYQHSELHQRVLREALKLANADNITDQLLSNKLKVKELNFDRTSITRFREGAIREIKKKEVAKELWNILRDEGIINIKFIIRQNLFSQIDLATCLNIFYETHDTQFIGIAPHITGIFFGYKKSLRRVRSILRSLFLIRAHPAGFLEVREYQVSQAHREADNVRSTEESEGLGFSKSSRIWFFLREIDFEQPRIFCFEKMKKHPDTEAINILYGHCLESSRKYDIGGFYSKTLLVRAPSSGPKDFNNEKLIAQLRSECDLIPLPEFGNLPEPYESSAESMMSSPLHQEILEWVNS